MVSGDPEGQRTDWRCPVKSPDHPGGSDSSMWKNLVDERFISYTCQSCHLIGCACLRVLRVIEVADGQENWKKAT